MDAADGGHESCLLVGPRPRVAKGTEIMPTPEQQREYTRLSGLLQQICMHYAQELPSGTTSVLLTNKNRKVRLEAYKHSDVIGVMPNDKTSTAFAADLTRYFADVTSPDPDGVVAIVSSPNEGVQR